jgi:hypothetical protein
MTIIQVNSATQRALGRIISGRPVMLTDPSPRVGGAPTSPMSVPAPGAFQEFFDDVRVPGKRKSEMEYYDYLETEISDVRRALDAYATMAVTGNLAGGGTDTYTICMLEDEDRYPDELRERLKATENLMKRSAYASVRMMCKYGTYTPELAVARRDDGRLGVLALRPIPPGTIYRNLVSGKSVSDKYWKQVIDGKTVAIVPQWKLPHFALWSNIVSATKTLLYGTSLLQPFGAIGLKVHAAVDAAVVARLTRAAMRYVWRVDVSDIKSDQNAIARRMRAWQRQLSRASTIHNTTTDEQESYQRTAVPDADFFVPAGGGLEYGLDTLSGDTNLARVGDIELLIRFYFGALGVLPEYLGHERSQGGRSNVSQVDIQFARSTRFVQVSAAAAFEHLVWVDMLLGGWDPREYPVEVVPPQIGARDDLLQAQIRALQSAVVMNLRAAGMKLEVNPRWILEVFLNLGNDLKQLKQEEIDQLFEAMPAPTDNQNSPGPNSKTVRELRERVAATTGDLMDIVRNNVMLLATGHDELAPELHRHEQPSPDELAAGLAA